MKNYYFNNSAWVFHHEIVVLSESAWRKAMDTNANGEYTMHWIRFEAPSLKVAKLMAKDRWDDIHVV